MDYISYTVPFRSLTHLFHNWKFLLLNLPHLLFSTSTFSLSIACLFSVYMFCFLHCCVYPFALVFFSSFMSEVIQHFAYCHMTYFTSIMTSRLIHVVTNSNISFFFSSLSNIPLCVYTYHIFFIYSFNHGH